MNKADRSLIRRANQEVSVFDVLEEHFDLRLPREGSSYKSYCPFQFEHPVEWEKNFRSYPGTNTTYCFEMHGALGPVRLIQLKEDIGPIEAATKLLDAKGLLKPKDVGERWAEVIAEREKKNLGSASYMVEALNTNLAMHPSYADGSISSGFMDVMEEQLNVLDIILNDPRASDVVVRAWYSRARVKLLQALDEFAAKAAV